MDSGNYWIYLKPHESETIYWGMNYNHWPGTRIGYYLEQEERWQVLRAGKRVFYDKVIGPRGTFCFKVEGFPSPYPADNINNGYHRPFIGPNLWISKPFKDPYIPPFIRKGDKNEKGNREIIELDDAIKRMKTPQYGHELGLQEIEEKPSKPIEIYISFGKKTTISKLILTCDTDLDNCFPHQNYGDLKIKDWGIIGKAPMCIKNLKIYSKNGQKERNLIKEIEGNFQRRIIINFENEIISDNLIIIPTNNWGFHTFNLYEVRVY